MDRARIASLPIPKDATEIKITQRDWGFLGPTKQLMELRYAIPYLSIYPIKLEDSESSNPIEIH